MRRENVLRENDDENYPGNSFIAVSSLVSVTELINIRSVTAIWTAIFINIGEDINNLLIDCSFLYS